jgi:hypothetical protein
MGSEFKKVRQPIKKVSFSVVWKAKNGLVGVIAFA